MLDRRQFLAASASAAALSAAPPPPPRPPPPAPAGAAPAAGDAAAEAFLARLAESLLLEHPENATTLGLDKGIRAHLKSRLTVRSPMGQAHEGATVALAL